MKIKIFFLMVIISVAGILTASDFPDRGIFSSAVIERYSRTIYGNMDDGLREKNKILCDVLYDFAADLHDRDSGAYPVSRCVDDAVWFFCENANFSNKSIEDVRAVSLLFKDRIAKNMEKKRSNEKVKATLVLAYTEEVRSVIREELGKYGVSMTGESSIPRSVLDVFGMLDVKNSRLAYEERLDAFLLKQVLSIIDSEHETARNGTLFSCENMYVEGMLLDVLSARGIDFSRSHSGVIRENVGRELERMTKTKEGKIVINNLDMQFQCLFRTVLDRCLTNR